MTTRPGGTTEPIPPPVAPTGVAGLDAILHGGLPREEMHLVQGVAGTGKTTLSLLFLREGARNGEACLYVTLSQSKPHLERIAASHGWPLDGITIHEQTPGAFADRIAARQTVLAAQDVELREVVQGLAEVVARVRPRRAVLDSISVVRLLAGGPQRYHAEVVTLRQLFTESGCTVLFLADHPAETEQGSRPEVAFHPLAGCVIHLEQEPRPYGDVRRRLRVVKARGMPHNGGYHDFKIRPGEMEVYPRLGAYHIPEDREYRRVESGIGTLDGLLGGGLEQGTSCLVVGPSGTGKSTLATVFVAAAARAGLSAGIFLFDERPETYVARSEGYGIELREHVEAGRVLVRQLDPGEIAPGEFAHQVRGLVEGGARLVVIDSVIGYFNAMGASDVLVTQLHELLSYLSRRGVLTVLCGAQEGFMSIGQMQAVDISYLSDTIMVLGFYEAGGGLRRCLAASKKKHGWCDPSIREYALAPGSVTVGDRPLAGLRNLLVRNAVPGGGGDGA
jgi:circadian clock protein KaiC